MRRFGFRLRSGPCLTFLLPDKSSMIDEMSIICPACSYPDSGNGYCSSCSRLNRKVPKTSDLPRTFKRSEVSHERITSTFSWIPYQWLGPFKFFIPLVTGAISFKFGQLAFFRSDTIEPGPLVIATIAAYATLVLILNKTKVAFSEKQIEVIRGPIPVPFKDRKLKLRVQDIERLDLTRIELSRSPASYLISAMIENGARVDILSLEDEILCVEIYGYLSQFIDSDTKAASPDQEKMIYEFKNGNASFFSTSYIVFFFVSLLVNIPIAAYFGKTLIERLFSDLAAFGIAFVLLFSIHYFLNYKINFMINNSLEPLTGRKRRHGPAAFTFVALVMALANSPIAMIIWNLVKPNP